MPNNEKLLNSVIEGIKEKKGSEIKVINLKDLDNSICDYFVICHADSARQVAAIADSVVEMAHKNTDDKLLHKEGYENAIWILLDYGDIVVHVFQEEYRRLYNLEALWGDATIKNYE